MSMYDCIYICVYNNKITTVYLNNFIGDIDAKLLRTCCKILIRFWSAGSVCYSFMISMKYCKTWWQYWQWWWWWWHQMTVWKRKTLIMAPGSQSSHGTWLWINMTMARNNGRVTRGKEILSRLWVLTAAAGSWREDSSCDSAWTLFTALLGNFWGLL